MGSPKSPANLAPPNVLPGGSDVSHVKPEPTSTLAERLAKSAQQRTAVHIKKLSGNVPFPQYDPYSEPVDVALLLDEISSTILRFIILDKIQADTAALWIAHTYLVDLFDASPLAVINAPERACAKTLFQNVLARMAFRPLSSSNATPSALFRSVELWRPTLFFDEADTFFKDNHELAGMINAGYKRDGFVLRSEVNGDSFMPVQFSVFGAKSIAGIALEKHLPDATMSRGIIFNMRRKLPGETVTRMRHAEAGLFEKISSKLVRFANDYANLIRQSRPALPDELSDRGQDNWEPLLAIASCAGDEWLSRATSAAIHLSRSSSESVSTGNELLSDIQQVFADKADSKYADRISTRDLIDALIAIEDGPWATYNQGRPMVPRQLSKQLSHYGIKPNTVRISAYDTPKGYYLHQFVDAFVRYLNPVQPDDVPEAEDAIPEAVSLPDLVVTSIDGGDAY